MTVNEKKRDRNEFLKEFVGEKGLEPERLWLRWIRIRRRSFCRDGSGSNGKDNGDWTLPFEKCVEEIKNPFFQKERFFIIGLDY